MKLREIAPLALVLSLSTLVTAGCKKADGDKSSEGSASAAASADKPKKPKRKKNEDSAVVKLAEKVVKECKWEKGWFDGECKAADEWREKQNDLLDEGKADADLLSLLTDERPAMRYLAAEALSSYGDKYKEDAALAAEVFDAAEAEKDEYVLAAFGSTLARVDYAKTKLVDRVKQLMKDGANVKMRAQFFSNVGYHNREDQAVEDALRDLTLTAASASDNALRAAVMRGLGSFDPNDKVCAAWTKGMADPKTEVIEAALDRAPAKCKSTFDAVIAATEKTDKPVFAFWYPRALIEVCSKGSADQKAKAQKLADEIANTSKSSASRSDALRAVATCDAEAGKTLAKKLSKDENEYVRKEAEKILKGS